MHEQCANPGVLGAAIALKHGVLQPIVQACLAACKGAQVSRGKLLSTPLNSDRDTVGNSVLTR